MALSNDMDWLRIDGLAWDWPIGLGLADWHRIGTDWHGLARIGKLENYWRNGKLAPDWQRIGSGLALIGLELNWPICTGLAPDWRIGTGLAKNWPIGKGLADWQRIG